MQPEMLPGGQALLFTLGRGFGAENYTIGVIPPKVGKPEILVENAMSPHYIAPNYLVFARSGSLWGVPFDAKRLKLTGTPVVLVQGIASGGDVFEQYATSENGVLIYVAGSDVGSERRVAELDRKGNAKTVTTENHPYEDLDLSPDGQHLAATIEATGSDVWTYDLQRNTLMRLTFENDGRDPFWSADGKRIVYTSFRKGNWGLYMKAADGTGLEKQIFGSPDWTVASSFSPDGRNLAFFQQGVENSAWILPLEEGGKPNAFLQRNYSVYFPTFSPDGRWIAYESNESGRSEIYVQSFRGEGGKWQVSSDGGSRPVWPRNDREIFFINGNTLMAAPVQTTSAFSAGTPHALFEGDFFRSGHYYDASPDGQHFYFIKSVGQTATLAQINVVLNWPSEIERLMQARESK